MSKFALLLLVVWGWLAPYAWAACSLPAVSRTLSGGLTMREAVDPEAGTVTMELVYQGEAWLSLGFSTNGKMVGSEAVVGLPDEGTVLLYDMFSEDASGIVPWSSQTLTDASIVQANGVTTLTFTKPLADPGKIEILADGPNTFLYAYGASNSFGLHQGAKGFRIDTALEQCGSMATGTTDVGMDNGAGDGGDNESAYTRTRTLWMVHGILLAISWGVLAPIAVGCSLLRDALPAGGAWFTLHKNINSLVFATTLAGFGIAVYLVLKKGDTLFSEGRHGRIGLAVVLLALLQVMSGFLRPHLPKVAPKEVELEDGAGAATAEAVPRKSTARIVFEYQHRLLGAALLGLSWYQCCLGNVLYANLYGIPFNANAVFLGVALSLAGLIVLGKIALLMKR